MTIPGSTTPAAAAARTGLVAAAALAGVAVPGCAAIPTGEPTLVMSCATSRFSAPYQSIDPCDATAVIRAAAETVFSYRPATQPDPGTALFAAAGLLDPGYLERTRASTGLLDPAASADWDDWSGRGVSVVATARITGDDHPPDTPRRASRVVAVTQQPSDATAARRLTVYMTAVRDRPTHAWRIDQMHTK